MLYAVGIGPLGTALGRLVGGLLLFLADRVTVRDERSAEVARGLPGWRHQLAITADPVLGIELPMRKEADGNNKHDEKKRIAVCLRDYHLSDHSEDRKKDRERFVARLAGLLRECFCDRGFEIVFVPFQVVDGGAQGVEDRLDDEQISLEMARLIGCERVVVTRGRLRLEDIVDVFTTCDAIVGERLHSLILAVSLGVPVFAIDYYPKIAGFMEMVGMGDYKLELSELVAANWDEERAQRSVEAFISSLDLLREKVARVRLGARAAALMNVEALSSLLPT